MIGAVGVSRFGRRRLGAVVFLAVSLAAGGVANASETRYFYDTLGRLIQVIRPNGGVTTYTYDAAGNRVKQTVSTGPGPHTGPVIGVVVLPLRGMPVVVLRAP